MTCPSMVLRRFCVRQLRQSFTRVKLLTNETDDEVRRAEEERRLQVYFRTLMALERKLKNSAEQANLFADYSSETWDELFYRRMGPAFS